MVRSLHFTLREAGNHWRVNQGKDKVSGLFPVVWSVADGRRAWELGVQQALAQTRAAAVPMVRGGCVLDILGGRRADGGLTNGLDGRHEGNQKEENSNPKMLGLSNCVDDGGTT